MKLIDYLYYKRTINRLRELIIEKKNNDYASKEDFYKNFKLLSLLLNLSIEKVILQFILVKVLRLTELIVNNKKPENESIEDTLIDLINYCEFLLVKVKYENEHNNKVFHKKIFKKT